MNVVLVAYVAVAGLFLAQTLEEGRRKRLPWNGYRMMGVVLSLAWPLTLVATAITVIRDAAWKRGGR